MIVLKKINSRLVEKTIPPGDTEEFFTIDLNNHDSFDWKVKILCGSDIGITKISSLYTNAMIDSTTYAFLGQTFNVITDISVFNGTHCRFSITNNEASLIKCSVRLKTF